jgi:ATP/maltotriose-dependent transcriptional regulator MalT
VRCRIANARIAAQRGEQAEALELSADALQLAEATDDPNLTGDALMARACVLEAIGQIEAAQAAMQTAIALYRLKGNVTAERRAAAVASAVNGRVSIGSGQE